jgi:PAS domain S-box-containing protein
MNCWGINHHRGVSVNDQSKTKERLIDELLAMRQQINELKREETERKRVEALLRRQQEEQQVIFDVVPAMIFFKDTENRFIRVNRALAEASGMTVEQMEGKSCFELFPDLADKYWHDDKEVMAAGIPRRDIIESMTTSDGVVWVKTDKIPFRDENGDIVGIIGFSIDITALKNTEKSIRKHFLFLETLIDTIPNPIFYKNTKGEYTGCNNAFSTYMGLTKEEILGKTVYDLSPEELADVYKNKDQALFDNPGVQVYESTVRYANGTFHNVIFNKATFTDGYGNVGGLVGVMVDITDRKRDEKIIVEAREMWERTFDAVPDLIAIMDNSFNVVQVNKSMAANLGLTPDECVGQVCYTVVHGTDSPPSYCPHFQTMKDHQEHQAEVSEEHLGGDFFVTTSPIFDQEGQMTGSVHVARDISERKKAEEEREKLILELREALSRVKTLSGLLPICASCKKIRNDDGYWEQIELYIRDRSEADFSHGICPECAEKFYPGYYKNK